jgi:hypothetical protein
MLRFFAPALVVALAATAAVVPAPAQAAPIGGGTTPRYCGSAWFSNQSGVGVCESTLAQCQASLQSAINTRLSWGWTMVSFSGCTRSQYNGGPFLDVASADAIAVNIRTPAEAEELQAADAELRDRYNVEQYQAERLQRLGRK